MCIYIYICGKFYIPIPEFIMQNLIRKFNIFIRKPFFSDYRTVFGLWMLLAVIAWVMKYFHHSYNNFMIFRQTFWHALSRLSLYAEYPAEYFDHNHYGPFFTLFVAPFAFTPVWLGLLSWLLFLSFSLYVATRTLPLEKKKLIFIYWFCAHELLTALFMSQFNIGIAAIIILSFTLIEKEKDIWATLLIVIGLFIKLYGVVGLAFFFFSRHKFKFIISFIGWSVFLLILPMWVWGTDYVLNQYVEWFVRLSAKNQDNQFALMQNISLLGMIRKISGIATYSDLYPICAGLLLFGLPYLRIKQYQNPAFRLTLLASVLMFVVLFSTGSESSTYIIAFMGVAIWYVAAPWKRSRTDVVLMVFAFILTSMSPSDLFPAYLRRHYITPYALKALPCVIIWLKLVYEMCFKDYALPKYKIMNMVKE